MFSKYILATLGIIYITTFFMEKRYGILYSWIYLIFNVLLLFDLPNKYKLLPIIMLIIYRKNLSIFGDFIISLNTLLSKHPIENRKNDNIVCSKVTEIFNKHFNIIHNFENIPKHKTIFVVNYVSDRIEHIPLIMIPRKICPVMGKNFISLVKLDKIVKHTISVEGKKNFLKTKGQIKEMLKNGICPLAYVEKPSSRIQDNVITIRTGIFKIAKELNITITPIVFDKISYNCFGIIQNQDYKINVGETFYVKNVYNSIIKTKKFFNKQIKINNLKNK